MKEKESNTFNPSNTQEWRSWLEKNHDKEQAVWLIYYKIKSGKPTISWSEAVDEALCFGWIDSTKRPLDEERFMQFFTRRKATSVWSKINKEKVRQLIDRGLMTKAGFATIETAKQNGNWTIMDEAEELTIPNDLEQEFSKREGSRDYFLSLSRSVRKSMLQWIVLAKRAETRHKRISELAALAAQKQKPKQFP
ncbi:MAG: YdeI/OmpD-associated family protein [Bacteroidota bacterium]